MHEPNEREVLARLSPPDVVLDIGGWARPFKRANYVMDAEPFDTRGYYGTPQGGTRECFTRDTWIRRDICDRTPYPFGDKELDFVICSHTLEDIRDPLGVCAEMMRIGKRGYLEVPSRVAETCRGVEPGLVGWSHHRWLIEIENATVTFLMKYHTIHSHWRFSLPAAYLRTLLESQKVQWLFWDHEFGVRERTIHGVDAIARELEAYVQRIRPSPAWKLAADRSVRRAMSVQRRLVAGVRRRLATGIGRREAGSGTRP